MLVRRRFLSSVAARDELTFIAFKPDALNRGCLSELMGRFERRGLQLRALKLLVPSRALAEQHYDQHRERDFFSTACAFISSGPVVASAWQGRHAVQVCRSMIGPMGPSSASPDAPLPVPGTIRGDYSLHWRRNLIHGSDSVEAAERELALWFSPHEIVSWQRGIEPWVHEL